MTVQFSERWNQYGLIADLAVKLKDVSPQLGKTVMQKMVYILQEVYGVPCDYDYILYNYGPYSGVLAEDLVFFESLEGVSINWGRNMGYEILPGAKAGHFIKRAHEFIEKYEHQINTAIENFGTMTAREIELQSTIIYVSKENGTNLEQRIKEIKPHFSVEEIRNSIEQLMEMKIIS